MTSPKQCSLTPPEGYDESAVRMIVAEVLHSGERYEKEEEE